MADSSGGKGDQGHLNPMPEGRVKEALLRLSTEAQELYLNSRIPVLAAAPSPLPFFREWVAANKPVVVQGVTQRWPALTRWTHDYLRDKLGHKEVSVAVTPNGYADAPCDGFFVMPEERTMKFGQFLDIMENPESQPGVFYIQKQNSNFTEEFSEILGDAATEVPWFSEALGKTPDAVNFWMGDGRAVTSMSGHRTNNTTKQLSSSVPLAAALYHSATCSRAAAERNQRDGSSPLLVQEITDIRFIID